MIYILGRCGVHPMQLSVIKFVSDLWQVGVFPGTSVSMTHDRSVVSPGVSDSQQVGDFTRYPGVFHKDSHDIIEKLLEAMFSIYLLK